MTSNTSKEWLKGLQERTAEKATTSCPVCAANVEVLGNTSMSYKNLDQEKLAEATLLITEISKYLDHSSTTTIWNGSLFHKQMKSFLVIPEG